MPVLFKSKYCIICLLVILTCTVLLSGCFSESGKKEAEKDAGLNSPVYSDSVSGKKLVIGDVSDEPTKKIRRYQPFAEYIVSEDRIPGYGIGEVYVTDSLEKMTEEFEKGNVHIIIEGAYNALKIADKAGACRILLNNKEGLIFFKSYFIALKDSPCSSLEDLGGKTLALEDTESTSGYFLPILELQKNNFNVSGLNGNNEYLKTVLSGEDEIIIQDLFDMRADTGVYSEYDFEELNKNVREKLKVIHVTEALPRSLLILSPALSKSDCERISDTLLELSNSEQGKSMLEHINSDGFYSVRDFSIAENNLDLLMEKAGEI